MRLVVHYNRSLSVNVLTGFMIHGEVVVALKIIIIFQDIKHPDVFHFLRILCDGGYD